MRAIVTQGNGGRGRGTGDICRFRSLRPCGSNRETGNNAGATMPCRVTCGGAGFERAIGKAREASADCAVERATKWAASDRRLIQNDSGLARGLAGRVVAG